jgi:hypothetical protein
MRYATSHIDSSWLTVLCSQALLTLIAVPYTLIAPHYSPTFYHVYVQLIIEPVLAFYWLISFAGMAGYLATVEWANTVGKIISAILSGTSTSDFDLWEGEHSAEAACGAIAGIGSLLL